MPPSRTLLIAADRLSREGLRRILDAVGFTICGEAATAGEALEPVSETGKPDFILIELVNDRSADITDVRDLRARFPDAKIVALAAHVSMAALAGTMAAGLDGYVLKDISSESLIQSLRLAGAGERVFPSRFADLLIRADVQTEGMSVPSPVLEQLSKREIQILAHLVTGQPNKAIALRLAIAESTVKVHLKSLLKKIPAENRTQAAIWAFRHGLSAAQET